MLNVGLVGVGKMGLSHLAILNAHAGIQSVKICELSGYVRGVLERYSGMTTYDNFSRLLEEKLDALVIATPSNLHARMVREALDKGMNVFCEKPFCLDPATRASSRNWRQKRSSSTKSVITIASSAHSTRRNA